MAVWEKKDRSLSMTRLIDRLGGDALGSASDLLYTPDGLVRQAKSNGQSVIYVGINYRLGGTQTIPGIIGSQY